MLTNHLAIHYRILREIMISSLDGLSIPWSIPVKLSAQKGEETQKKPRGQERVHVPQDQQKQL